MSNLLKTDFEKGNRYSSKITDNEKVPSAVGEANREFS